MKILNVALATNWNKCLRKLEIKKYAYNFKIKLLKPILNIKKITNKSQLYDPWPQNQS